VRDDHADVARVDARVGERRADRRSWAFGHLIAGAGIVDTVVALRALRQREVPGLAPLVDVDAQCAGLNISASAQTPRSDVALILCRGFAGTNAAVLVRA
jgi:3-oxoacyl-[acyl-carrier-protein] synthase-1